MNKARVVLVAVGVLLLALSLVLYMDFSDFSWTTDRGVYLTVISLGFLIASLIMGIRDEKKRRE